MGAVYLGLVYKGHIRMEKSAQSTSVANCGPRLSVSYGNGYHKLDVGSWGWEWADSS